MAREKMWKKLVSTMLILSMLSSCGTNQSLIPGTDCSALRADLVKQHAKETNDLQSAKNQVDTTLNQTQQTLKQIEQQLNQERTTSQEWYSKYWEERARFTDLTDLYFWSEDVHSWEKDEINKTWAEKFAIKGTQIVYDSAPEDKKTIDFLRNNLKIATTRADSEKARADMYFNISGATNATLSQTQQENADLRKNWFFENDRANNATAKADMYFLLSRDANVTIEVKDGSIIRLNQINRRLKTNLNEAQNNVTTIQGKYDDLFGSWLDLNQTNTYLSGNLTAANSKAKMWYDISGTTNQTNAYLLGNLTAANSKAKMWYDISGLQIKLMHTY